MSRWSYKWGNRDGHHFLNFKMNLSCCFKGFNGGNVLYVDYVQSRTM